MCILVYYVCIISEKLFIFHTSQKQFDSHELHVIRSGLTPSDPQSFDGAEKTLTILEAWPSGSIGMPPISAPCSAGGHGVGARCRAHDRKMRCAMPSDNTSRRLQSPVLVAVWLHSQQGRARPLLRESNSWVPQSFAL